GRDVGIDAREVGLLFLGLWLGFLHRRRDSLLGDTLLAWLHTTRAGRRRLVARFEFGHTRQELLDAVFIELDAGVRIFHRDHRTQAIRWFHHARAHLEPLHQSPPGSRSSRRNSKRI